MDKNNAMWNLENPWIGLGSYDEGQKLYGRNNEISILSEIILNNLATIVYGKSGIGKSSLLRAGIFPILRERNCTPIYIRLNHNTDISYSQQIQNAIIENVNTIDLLPKDIPSLGLWDFFHRNEFINKNGDRTTPVIVLDQFEEIYTLTDLDHKSNVQQLFIELADILNGVKPDKVIKAEISYNQTTSTTHNNLNCTGFSLQTVSSSSLKYNKNNSFRLIITLRDDSLYLLERNSAKIPSLKVNRYNLCALDKINALDVINKPLPGLFNESESIDIINNLAYYEFDDFQVIDPSILSLFLFSYYKEQGKVSYNDIFKRYYLDCIKRVNERAISLIEDQLLTKNGNRKQVPLKDTLALGINYNEISSLIQNKILKTEIRKGIEYIEFSHDRLCEQALKHRDERNLREQNKIMYRKLGIASLFIIIFISISLYIGYQNTEIEQKKNELEQQKAEIIKQKAEIEKQNIELEKQNIELEFKKDSLEKLNQLNLQQQDILNSKNKEIKNAKINVEIAYNNLDSITKEYQDFRTRVSSVPNKDTISKKSIINLTEFHELRERTQARETLINEITP